MAPSPNKLAEQERKVLYCAAAGMIDREIAEHLGIAVGTVRIYWNRVRAKLGTRGATQTVLRAAARGLIDAECLMRIASGEEAPPTSARQGPL